MSGGGDYGAKGDNSGGGDFQSADYGEYAPPGLATLDSYHAPTGSGAVDFTSPDVSGPTTGWSDSTGTAGSGAAGGGTLPFAHAGGNSGAFPIADPGGGQGLGSTPVSDPGYPSNFPIDDPGIGAIPTDSGGNPPGRGFEPVGPIPIDGDNPIREGRGFEPVGPAGTSGTPNITAFQNAGNDSGGSDLTPLGATTAGVAGPSAASAGIAGGGPASGDLSAARNRAAGPDDSGWMNSMGIKNPIGAAIAAGGMGFNMLQQQKLNKQIGTPSADLAQLARDLKSSTSGITPAGTAIATQGVDDLRARAADLSPNAQTLQDRGTGLTGYAGTGTLPPAMQAQVDQATQDAKTARISFYASRNMPTDPTKNTSLRSDFERIDRDATIMASTMASDLAKTGTGIYGAGLQGSGQAGGYEGTAGQIGTNLVNSGIQASGLQSTAYNQLAQIDAAQTARTQQAIADMARALSNTPQQQNIVVPIGRA